MKEEGEKRLDRRRFLGASSSAIAYVSLMSPHLVRGSSANSAVRVGLLGCGGRGTTVAGAMLEHPNTRIVALADIFEDRLREAHQHFNGLAQEKGHSPIDKNQLFSGAGAYREIAASKQLDAIIIASPDFLHPLHLGAVVEGGKHVYSEKPTGVDVAGAKRYMEIGKKVDGKLSIVVGHQIRKAPPFVKLIDRIHDGALGTIVCGQGYYYTGKINLPDWEGLPPAERKLRRWYYYRELSGGILVDQGIHVLDIFNWALKSHPVKASGGGGRKVRTDEGNCWDHYNLTYFYPGGTHVTFSSTQFDSGWNDVAQRIFGTDGVSESHYNGPMRIHGNSQWSLGSENSANLADANREKTASFIQSIVDGKFLNETRSGAESTLTAVLGRMAAERGGDEVDWVEMMASNQSLDPGLDLGRL